MITQKECTYCPRLFSKESSWKNHIHRKHREEHKKGKATRQHCWKVSKKVFLRQVGVQSVSCAVTLANTFQSYQSAKSGSQ